MSEIKLSKTDIQPLVEVVVDEVFRRVSEERAKLGGRLAMSEPEAAAALGLKVHVLRDYRLAGLVPHVRLGRRVLYSREALAEFLRRAARNGG